MKKIETLFEEVRELAFRQMNFEKLPQEEQEKELGVRIFPEWNEKYCAEYTGDARHISFWLESEQGATQLSKLQQAVISALYTEKQFDGWKVEDVKIESDTDNKYIDLVITITNI